MVDSSAAPSGAPSTSQVFAVAANNITNPIPNDYYPVHSGRGRGNAGYCAWHSWGLVNGVLVQFAFFFNLDGDPGCSSGGHSQGLAALGNVSGHELSEALTDPHGDAWYDNSGAENAVKCAWTFSTNLVQFLERLAVEDPGQQEQRRPHERRQLPRLRIRLHRRQLARPVRHRAAAGRRLSEAEGDSRRVQKVNATSVRHLLAF